MTVAELIQLLHTCRQEARVIIHGYEGGFHDVGSVNTQAIKLNVNNEWYYGPHDWPGDLAPDETAYLITWKDK